MAGLMYLVIHCTATPKGREVSADDIRRWHTSPPPEGRGWKQVGYTDLIHLDGSIERLTENNEDDRVDTCEITNGAKGFNKVSRHIVYVGGLSSDGLKYEDTRTNEQKKALRQYVREFHARFPNVQIIGHHDLNPSKICPSFNVKKMIND